MLVTDDEAWARRARYLTTQAKDDPIEYVHDAIGYNYRLTNVQAAIGVAQMERLESIDPGQAADRDALRGCLAGHRRHQAHGRGALGGQRLLDVHRAGGPGSIRV